MAADVDLVVNTFERTYRSVLSDGFFTSIAEQNRFTFTRRLALINNVSDRQDAVARAEALVSTGELDGYRVVSDHLQEALAVTGLQRRDLGRIPHYSDCSLVAVTLPGPEYLLYWDADVHLEEAHDWVTPSVTVMEGEPRVLVANPRWTRDENFGPVTIYRKGDFAFGRGFSDQMYLVRRRDFRAPIYGVRCAAALRFPMSAVEPIFEARVDAYMRHSDLLRATYLRARYSHPTQDTGTATESLHGTERVRHLRNRLVVGAIRRSPVKRGCWQYM